MKRNPPEPASHRLPVDFGKEPECCVGIHRRRSKNGRSSGRQSALTNSRLNRPAINAAGPAQPAAPGLVPEAQPEISQTRSVWNSSHKLFRPERTDGIGPAPLSLQDKNSTPMDPDTPCLANFRRRSATSLRRFNVPHHKSGFTLVEILVVLVLLSMIVLALMAVFSGIQRAFRASLTQTDTLEGGRAVMDMIANDLATMTPSYGYSNLAYASGSSGNGIYLQINPTNPPTAINFATILADYSSPPSPLFQPLLSSPSGVMRTDILENIFILSKGNINGVPSWIATGYSVNTNLPDGTLYPLYRFYMTTNISAGSVALATMYNSFASYPNYDNSTNWSHLMDGVVDLTATAYDTNGVAITNGYRFPQSNYVQNVYSLGSTMQGVSQCWFCSNAIPASVQIEMGTIEDRTLVHAQSLGGVNQSNYLSSSANAVHIFRQRVWIPNLDLSAYQ